MVVNELRGEKIDIVPFSEDFQDFVAKALSPAKVSQVIVSDDGTQADVIVPDHQLSLAIGREGQNARLAARLTGVRIDIRSETQLAEGVPPRRDELDEGVEYAEGQWVDQRRDRRDGVARRRRQRDQRGRVERPGRAGGGGAAETTGAPAEAPTQAPRRRRRRRRPAPVGTPPRRPSAGPDSSEDEAQVAE